MPVHDMSYRAWEGKCRGPLRRWLAIPKFAFMEAVSRRLVIWLFTLGCVQLLLRLGYLYLLANQELLVAFRFPTDVLPPANAFFFKNFIDIQLPFCFALAFVLGADLIAGDMRHGALVLYVSKPISRWEYFFGKFFVLFSVFMLLTWAQAGFLFLVQWTIAAENTPWRLYFWNDRAPIFGSITAYCLVIAVCLTMLCLATSSLIRNARYFGTAMVVYIIGLLIIGRMLYAELGDINVRAVSPLSALVDLGYHQFDLAHRREMIDPGLIWISIAAHLTLCAVVFKWRLEKVVRHGR